MTKFDKNIDRAIKILYNGATVVASPIDIIMPFKKYLIYKREEDIFYRFKKLFLSDNLETYDIELQLIAEELIKSGELKSLTDVQDSINALYSNMIQILLNEELNSHLGYDKEQS